MLCYAEVGSRFTGTGGPYLYAREAFGPVVGFEAGRLLWLARVSAFAANCNLLIGYIGYFWPAAGLPVQRAVLICSLLAAIVTINVIGVRNATRANHFFTAGKLIPILIFVVAGVWFVQPQRFTFGAFPSYGSFSMAVLLLVYAFTGFEMAVIRNRRNQRPATDGATRPADRDGNGGGALHGHSGGVHRNSARAGWLPASSGGCGRNIPWQSRRVHDRGGRRCVDRRKFAPGYTVRLARSPLPWQSAKSYRTSSR